MRCGLPPKQRRRGFPHSSRSGVASTRLWLAPMVAGLTSTVRRESIAADTRPIATGPEPRPEPGGRPPAPPRPAAGQAFRARRLAMLSLFEDEFRPEQADATLERLGGRKGRAGGGPRPRPAGSSMACCSIERSWMPRSPGMPGHPGQSARNLGGTILRSAIYEVLYSAATPSGRPSTMPYLSPGHTPETQPAAS